MGVAVPGDQDPFLSYLAWHHHHLLHLLHHFPHTHHSPHHLGIHPLSLADFVVDLDLVILKHVQNRLLFEFLVQDFFGH